MHRDEEEPREIVVVEEQDPAEQAIQEELGEFLGAPDASQKKILADLARLHHSLRGPEKWLDQGNYSRPVPPNNRTRQSDSAETTSRNKRQGD